MSSEHSTTRENGNERAPSGIPLAYSVDQYAEICGLGRSFLYEAIRNGDLEARKAGRRTLILKDEGERFLRELPALGTAA